MSTILGKQFEQDPAKAKSREWLKQKILERFPDDAGRKSLTAVFLTGPSLAEAEQIYLPLGFSPSNLYGIERDPRAFKAVKAQNDERPEGHRINLLNADDSSVLDGSRRFNVISLDYLQNYGPAVLASLDRIFEVKHPCAAKDSFLAINTQARREHPRYQLRMNILGLCAGAFSAANAALTSEYLAQYGKADAIEAMNTFMGARNDTVKGLDKAVQTIAKRKVEHPESPFFTTTVLLRLGRMSIFEEVYLRSELSPLRRFGPKDLEGMFAKNPKCWAEQKELLDSVSRAYEGISHISEGGETFDDILRLAYYSAYHLEALYSLLFLRFEEEEARPNGSARMHTRMYAKIMEQAPAPPRMVAQMGFVTSKLNGTAVLDYDTFEYTSASGTPMAMHSFSLRNMKEHLGALNPEPSGTQMQGADNFNMALMRIFQGNDSRYKDFRNALGKYYRNGYGLWNIVRDIKIWTRFRAGTELLNALRSVDMEIINGSLSGVKQLEDLMGASLKCREKLESRRQEALEDVRLLIKEYEEPEGWGDGSGEENSEAGRAENPLRKEEEQSQAPAEARAPPEPPSAAAPAAEEPLRKQDEKPAPVSLNADDKEAIRALAREGYTPKEIYETLYSGTSVTRAQISSVCAWNKIRAKKANGA